MNLWSSIRNSLVAQGSRSVYLCQSDKNKHIKGGYYHLPSMLCVYFGEIFCGLRDENINLR